MARVIYLHHASAVPAARLVAAVGVRRLLVTGLSVLAVGVLWLTRLPADAGYALDLLPAVLLAGVGLGLCAPSVQIGALSGVSESDSGLASGLVETMREIGGAAGVATVTTMLVSRSGLAGFHAAFAIIGVLAILGAVTAATGFRRNSGPVYQPTGNELLAPADAGVSARFSDARDQAVVAASCGGGN